jgi:Transport and Golgi organisation 2
MCTLSLVPKADGFLLGMNRDEQRTRTAALPPALHRSGDHSALYPFEPAGGTWIGINEAGLCVALINWYSRPQYQGDPAFSRGAIIPRLLAFPSLDDMERSLFSLPLERLNPFRLFVIGRNSGAVREYRSEGSGTERVDHPLTTAHWFSSGYDEASAITTRSVVCLKAAEEPDAGTLPWLERLHSSHEPEEGAASICMHRDDAETVSMTILEVSGESAAMRYHAFPPCRSLGVKPHHSRLTLFSPGVRVKARSSAEERRVPARLFLKKDEG